jgi:hypothetical protein
MPGSGPSRRLNRMTHWMRRNELSQESQLSHCFDCVGLGQSETVRQLKQLTQLESRYEKP